MYLYKRFGIHDLRGVSFSNKDILTTFGGNSDLWIFSDCNNNKKNNTNLGKYYGKNEGANARDLTKEYKFTVKEIEVYFVKLE